MSYPLPTQPNGVEARKRIVPPLGCPGFAVWVVPHLVQGWLELGYRLGDVPALPLELFWQKLAGNCKDPIGSETIELVIDPLGIEPAPISITWGDGQAEVLDWSPFNRELPSARHRYSASSDYSITVTIGSGTRAELLVGMQSCPLCPCPPGNGGGGALQALVPGAGLAGESYDGTSARQWQLHLHPSGGLGYLTSPVDGKPALAVIDGGAGGGGADGRGSRWYTGNGSPDLQVLLPTPEAGDFYLDSITGFYYTLN